MRRKQRDDHDDDEIKLEEKHTMLTHTHGHHKFSDKEKIKMQSFQSLDFSVMDNQVLHEYNRKNTKLDFIIADIGKWIICFWIGVIIGAIAYLIKFSVDFFNHSKYILIEKYIMNKPAIAFAYFAGLNLAFAFVASLVIIIIKQPLAGGSGIPEVKGYLNGVRISNSLNIKTLIGKLISLIFAFSASLILGPEGPMIHIGSMIGAAVGQLKSKTLKLYPRIFWRYHNDRDRRDFISCGAAAGVAAAFGAPIGGVLFSIEEASSFWSQELTWRTFFTCLCATLTVSAFQNGMETVVKNHGMLTFGLSQSYLYRLPEIGAFAILGAIGGLLGAAYVYVNVKLNRFRAKTLHYNGYKLVEVILVSIITSGVLFMLSMVFPCANTSDIIPSPIPVDCSPTPTNQTLINFKCPVGQYSPMGSLMIVTPDAALRALYTRDQGTFTMEILGVACVAFFFLAVIASGILLAGGLFIPMMLVGATSGRLFGKVLALMFPHVYPALDPSVYALVGTAAVMAGFSRMTISLVVIIVELTQGTQYLLPIILSVMISKWVGDVFTEAYYENMMELKCIPYLHSSPPQEMLFFSVAEIMRRDVVDLSIIEKVSDLVRTLGLYNHGAFPVVDRGHHNNSHYFRGMITHKQLLVLLKNKVFTSLSDDLNQQMTVPSRITYEDFTESLARLDFTVADVEKELSPRDLELHVDLSPYINVSATVVHETCSYTEAYRLFRTMGLRHLVVINVYNQVVGIITRKDLL
eukprot:Phypoly_transcript_01809.p1 GENE.Phypoly_transcript_01809~~Phypoly_transcript_01809.p1  ORF type:complete len:747 (+),score=78.68 Phypoly_transcript_01809:857-3097(+)